MAGPPPSVQHAGFLVPNAGVVVDPKMAEPDQIDFNTLGNARWGVIEGCRVTVTGTTATLAVSGTAIVNGVLVRVKAGSAALGIGGSQDRFDLLVTDLNGSLMVVPGTPSADPVFPEPSPTQTVLAAVLCRAGVSVFDEYVIDKRNLLRDALLTKLPLPTDPLVRSINGTSDLYLVDGNGKTTWASDTWVARTAAETLHIHRHLEVESDLFVGDDVSAETLTATGLVRGSNLQNGTDLPPTGVNGDIFQQTSSGRIYAWTNNHWEELVTSAGAVPIGAVMTSLQGPTFMIPLGWVPLDGRTVTESTTPTIFTVDSLQPYISGLAPNRVMTMPDATRRVLIADFSAGAGFLGGESSVVLRESQMPRHKHNVAANPGGAHGHAAGTAGRTGRAGIHTHLEAPGGGKHIHNVSETPHRHPGMDYYGHMAPIITVIYGGQNKIDALFNDRSHTFSVDAIQWTAPALSGVSVGESGSEHAHIINQGGDHDHPVAIGDALSHAHTVTEDERGGTEPVDVTGSYMTVYVYVRS